MQEAPKVTIDLLFCTVLTFLIVYTANYLNKNDQLSNNSNAESVRITADNFQENN